jgi:hypothetical protein
MNLKQSNSKVSSCWIFYFVEVELIKLWMVPIVGKEWGLLNRSLDGVVVRKLGKWLQLRPIGHKHARVERFWQMKVRNSPKQEWSNFIVCSC